MLDDGYTITEIGDELEMSVRSVRYYMRIAGITVRSRFSDISTRQLENYVYQIVTENNNLGEVSVRSRLGQMGLKVQRRRVREAIKKTVGHLIQPRRIRRRQYFVRSPLSLLHIDGNHKLIL